MAPWRPGVTPARTMNTAALIDSLLQRWLADKYPDLSGGGRRRPRGEHGAGRPEHGDRPKPLPQAAANKEARDLNLAEAVVSAVHPHPAARTAPGTASSYRHRERTPHHGPEGCSAWPISSALMPDCPAGAVGWAVRSHSEKASRWA